jgi:hypothetical protein
MGFRWPWQKSALSDVEKEIQEIEKEERRTQKHYRRIASLAIWTIAIGAVVSTSSNIIDKLFGFAATPAQIGSLAGYFIAVLVGNSMMFAGAKKILYAIEIRKEWDITERISVAVIALVMSIETISFLYFLWNFEGLNFDREHAIKIIISAGRAVILSSGAVFLELYLSPGVSPARIQTFAQKVMGLGTLVDFHRIMRNADIATTSKVNMYAASLEEYDTPADSLRAIADAAEELVDKSGNPLLIIPKARDPYMIDSTASVSLASAQRGGTIETDNPVVFASAEKKKTSAKVEKPAKKKPIVTRKPRSTEREIETARVAAIKAILSGDEKATNYAIAQQLNLDEKQVSRLRKKHEI